MLTLRTRCFALVWGCPVPVRCSAAFLTFTPCSWEKQTLLRHCPLVPGGADRTGAVWLGASVLAGLGVSLDNFVKPWLFLF